MHLKQGDDVVVISGNERGKRGRVLRILKDEDRVVVEGVNTRLKYLKKTPQNPQGGEVEREFPLHASNVLLWSEKADKGVRTRIGRDDQGRRIRIGIPCGTKFG